MMQSKTGLAALLGQSLMKPQGLPMGNFGVGQAPDGRNMWQGNQFLMGRGPAVGNAIVQPLPAFDPPSINPDPGENPLPPGEVQPPPSPFPIPPQEPGPAPLPSPIPVPMPETPNPQPLPPPQIPPMTPSMPIPPAAPASPPPMTPNLPGAPQSSMLSVPNYGAMDMSGLAAAIQQLMGSPAMMRQLLGSPGF